MILENILKEVTEKGFGSYTDKIKNASTPCINIINSEDNSSFSKLGGLPELPSDLHWPENLAFLAQFKLSEIPKFDSLPEKGLLYFFYDNEEQPWGLDETDKDMFKILYHSNEDAELTETPLPTSNSELNEAFDEKKISFILGSSVPSVETVEDGELYDDEFDEIYDAYIETLEEQTLHQIGGYPFIEQNDDMQEDCEEKRAKITGEPINDNPRDNWFLLFQIDTDDVIEMMWGDMGKLFFWIRKDDLTSLKFENAWIALQCG